MTDVLEKFRLSLIPRAQLDAFEGPDPTRENYLRKIFSERIVFQHRGIIYHFVPDSRSEDRVYIIGQVGRPITLSENAPPELGLSEQIHDTWKAAVFALDPTNHKDGQKLIFERDSQVGKPSSLLQSLFAHINNENSRSAYHIECKPIFNPGTFWKFASENKGEITSITFEFVTPNGLFNANVDVRDELKGVQNETGAETVVTTFRSQDGINTDGQRIKEGVEYSESGGGDIRARAKSGKRFNSKNNKDYIRIPKESDDNRPLLARITNRIREFLQ